MMWKVFVKEGRRDNVGKKGKYKGMRIEKNAEKRKKREKKKEIVN